MQSIWSHKLCNFAPSLHGCKCKLALHTNINHFNFKFFMIAKKRELGRNQTQCLIYKSNIYFNREIIQLSQYNYGKKMSRIILFIVYLLWIIPTIDYF